MTRILIVTSLALLSATFALAAGITKFSQQVAANGKNFAVTGVKVDLKDPHISLRLGLAGGALGRTEGLADIAKRYGAAVAINGSYFDAYSGAARRNPDMSLISGGQLMFKSNIGCLLGFEADNTPHLGCLRWKLVGTIERDGKRPQSWHSYWINRQPTSSACVTMFTKAWGPTPGDGTSVLVKGGAVAAIGCGAQTPPEDGFVLHIKGDDKLLGRFRVGDQVTFAPECTIEDGDGSTLDEWAKVREAIGCGPRVLAAGKPVFDPTEEGFNDPKVLQLSGARSAVGFTADKGTLVLITVKAARVADLGHILKALGCSEGMNLDGGASSGLYFRGAYLTTPGRQISNALVVVEK